jgi:hypothetical protein
LLTSAAACGLLTAQAAAAEVAAPEPAWIVTPATEGCRTEIELAGVSGAVARVSFVSNGQGYQLVYAKQDAPERAFLPIRIDHRPFANLVLRQADGRSAAMQLSPETVAALRKGGVLQIGWLAEAPVQARLAGSERGLSDLKVCGAQVAARFREQQQVQREAQARADADARAQAISDEQLAAARAQKDAAEAAARRDSAEADRLQAAAETERARAQADAEAARQRAEDEAREAAYPYARAGDYGPDPQDSYYPRDPYGGYEPQYGPYRRW